MILQSTRVWIANQFIPAQLEVAGGKIAAVLPHGTRQADRDYGDLRIVPGFIDIHAHGAYGFDTNDAEPQGLRNWLKRVPQEGVTSICPTTITQSNSVLTKALENVACVAPEGYEGAEILGVHLEGPYLCQKYKGAQPAEHIIPPSIAEFDAYQKAAGGLIRLITLAPENDEDYALTRHCAQSGIAVSMGHSDATYEQAVLAVGNGATSMTHVHNAMSPYSHRAPGLVGAALRMRDVFGEIICDGIHVDWAAVNNLFTAKGRDHAILITDSLQAKGCPKATYVFGGNEITIYDDGSAHIAATGVLAGSTLTINQGLRGLVEQGLVPFDAALNACTINPARLLRVDDRKGKLAAGYDADIVVLGGDYSVEDVYCRGNSYRG